MKKLVCLALALLMAMSLVACGGNDKIANESTPATPETESVEQKADDIQTESVESKDDTQTESVENNNDSAEWKEFLKDYEEWVDEYIALMKKQKENPTDLTILSDYSKMTLEMAEWAEKSDDIAGSIEDTDEALEYSKEVLRIAGKLSEIG